MVWFTVNGDSPLFDDGYEAFYEAARAADASGCNVEIFDVYSPEKPIRVISPGETPLWGRAYAAYLRAGAADLAGLAWRFPTIRERVVELERQADQVMLLIERT